MIETLKSSVGKMNDLLVRLSQHSQTRHAAIEPMDVEKTIAAVVHAKRLIYPIETDFSPGLFALADAGRVGTILNHLVQNAIDATEDGSPIRISASRQDDWAAIRVSDRGCGMSEAFVANQLFKPFDSTKEGGFGIGAYEARTLALIAWRTAACSQPPGERHADDASVAHIGKAGTDRRIERGGMNMEPKKQKLLIVEDDLGLQRQLKWSYEDFDVLCAANRAEALALLRSEEPEVVTLDLGLPPDPDGVTEGFATLDEMLRLKPDTKVIVASGHNAKESALRAISAGAWDFYQKPVDIDELHLIVKRAFHVRELEVQNRKMQTPDSEGETLFGTMVTASPEMLKAARTIERVANTNVSVMLLGASGTGKELLARGLHDASDRRHKPFVAINCGAIPENLLKSELFGYEKGAFTGAIKTTEGKVELANGGTLFLDEVGDIPLPLQVKLLRFLQERVVERIGGRKPIAVDVRIVCATHRDLNQMITDKTFRDDPHYRLAEVPVPHSAIVRAQRRCGSAGETFSEPLFPRNEPVDKGVCIERVDRDRSMGLAG